jgi:predicted Zn finger-like uncharacterized protein
MDVPALLSDWFTIESLSRRGGVVIVQCPYCATRYRIDSARLSGPSPQLKCSRCDHVFPAPAAKGSTTASPAAEKKPGRPRTEKAPSPAEESLTLPFEEASWKAEADEELPGPAGEELSLPDSDEEFTLGDTEPAASEAPWPEVVTAAAETDEAPPKAAPRAVRRVAPPAEPRPRAARNSRRVVERDVERGKVVVVMLFLTATVAAYSVLTATLFTDPALWDRWLGNLPWVGTLRDDRLLTRKVALSEVTGSYQRIKDGKAVFVITGRAMNTAPVSLQGVQITGKLLDEAGRALEEKTIHCGNVISTKVLKDLTHREVSVLQTLSPPPRFMIEPGESSTFVIVFMEPPSAATTFAAQVVAAHRQA